MPDTPEVVVVRESVYGTWTRSGQRVSFDNPDPETIVPEDIAQQLADEPRWSGACTPMFSVLNHELYCDDIGVQFYHASNQLRAQILLHDGHEAYMHDLSRGLKALVPELRDIQKRLDVAIWKAFGIQPPTEAQIQTIHRIDDYAAVGEARDYLPEVAYEILRQMHGEALDIPATRHEPGVAIAEFKARCYEVGLKPRGEK